MLKYVSLCIVLIFFGCAKPKVMFEEPIVIIINNSNSIADIYIKKCYESKQHYLNKVINLEPNYKTKNNVEKSNVYVLKLKSGQCYDLKATDTGDGHIIGTQKEVSVPPELQWILR